MTNKPTIDGVSRELLPCPFCGSSEVSLAWDVYDTDRGRRTQSQVRCLGCRILTKTFNTHADARSYWNSRPLLDAPAVERQPIKNASEVAYNLQAENARLEARITQLEAEAEFAAATYQAARDRLAELESGRGEPAYYRIQAPKVTVGGEVTEWWPACVLYSKEQLAEIVGPYKIEEELFTAPPAPVAQVIDEQQAFANWTHEVIGMRGLAKVQRRDEMTAEQEKFALKGWLARACLDATAALNGVKS